MIRDAHKSLPNRHPARILLCHPLPPRCPWLYPLNLRMSLQMAKEDFTDVIKLRSFRGEITLDHASGPKHSQASLSEEDLNTEIGDVMMEARDWVPGGRGHESRKAGGLQELQKARKMGSPLDSPEWTSSAKHCDISPVRLLSDTWLPEL